MDEQRKKDFLRAGVLANEALHYGKSLMTQGAKAVDVLDKVEDFIVKKGAVPAFPAQISHNAVAAHACSDLDDQTTIKTDDVVKLDVGVCVNGMIGDNALTVNLSGEYQELIDASKAALEVAAKRATVGTKVGEIGQAIQDTITSYGFSPVQKVAKPKSTKKKSTKKRATKKKATKSKKR